jgi:hypothetical protein
MEVSPTINAPWANEDDEQPLGQSARGCWLVSVEPFNLPGTYGPLRTNVDAIVGDAMECRRFARRLCGEATFGHLGRDWGAVTSPA